MIAATLLSIAIQAAPPPISVFVGPHTRDGFVDVDAGVVDSIRDIQNELKRSRRFTVAPTADRATITLIVLGRRISGNAGAVGITTGGSTFGGGTIAGVPQPTYSTPGVTTMVPIDRRAIDVLLRFRAYEKPIVSEDESGSGVWRAAAQRVVKDVTAWVDANRAALAQ